MNRNVRARVLLGGCVFLLAAAPGFAEVGDMAPTCECDTRPLWGLWLIARGDDFTGAPQGCGVVNRNAVVASNFPNTPIAVAIDSAEPDATAPDVIRFNFDGRTKFDDTHVLPLVRNPGGSSYQASFGPKILLANQDGKTIPVRVEGTYRKSRSSRRIQIRMTTALTGECAFGEKTYPVYLIDGNANLKLGDSVKITRRRGWATPGDADTIAVRCEARASKGYVKAFYGQPVLIDGVWYRVELSADKTRVEVTPDPRKTGLIRIPQSDWGVVLVQGKVVLQTRGGLDPVPVPVGTYEVIWFDQKVEQANDSRSSTPAMLWLEPSDAGGKGCKYEVKAGQTTELALGSPIRVDIQADVKGRQVVLQARMTDDSGIGINRLTSAKGNRPTPGFNIFDSTGKKVHSGSFEYG